MASLLACRCTKQQQRHSVSHDYVSDIDASQRCVVCRCLDVAKRANRCSRTGIAQAWVCIRCVCVCVHVRVCICKELSKPTALSHIVAVNDATSAAMKCSRLRCCAARRHALSLVRYWSLFCFAFSSNWYLLMLLTHNTNICMYLFIYFSHFCRNFIWFAFSSSLLCENFALVCRQRCHGYLCSLVVRKY